MIFQKAPTPFPAHRSGVWFGKDLRGQTALSPPPWPPLTSAMAWPPPVTFGTESGQFRTRQGGAWGHKHGWPWAIVLASAPHPPCGQAGESCCGTRPWASSCPSIVKALSEHVTARDKRPHHLEGWRASFPALHGRLPLNEVRVGASGTSSTWNPRPTEVVSGLVHAEGAELCPALDGAQEPPTWVPEMVQLEPQSAEQDGPEGDGSPISSLVAVSHGGPPRAA